MMGKKKNKKRDMQATWRCYRVLHSLAVDALYLLPDAEVERVDAALGAPDFASFRDGFYTGVLQHETVTLAGTDQLAVRVTCNGQQLVLVPVEALGVPVVNVAEMLGDLDDDLDELLGGEDPPPVPGGE